MAKGNLVKFRQVTSDQLSDLAIVGGQIIFVSDTGKMYIDADASTRVQIDGVDFSYGLGINGRTITISKNGGSQSIVIPADTTYTFAQDASDGHKIIITPSDGSGAVTLTIPDNNTTYDEATTTVSGLMSAADKAKIDGIEEGATKVIVDSALSSSSSNAIANNIVKNALDNKLETSLKGAKGGLAELDSNGFVPSSQLPSYVDDVLEYSSKSGFPTTGETGKIYVAKDTNLTYRWSGSDYVEISASLALGETSSTAYRGDYGAAAYKHAVTNKGKAYTSGFYKITTNSEGHVTAATAVAKADITGLGIPAQDTTYVNATTSAAGLMSAADKTKLDGIATGANKITVDSALSSSSTNPVQNKVINTALAGKSATSHTHTLATGATDVTATAAELNKLDGATVSTTEINYLKGVTSAIQTQLNGKLSTSGTAAKATADASGNTITTTYEKLSNKTTVLNANSTTTQYPSAKTVYDAIQAMSGSSAKIATSLSSADTVYYLTGVTDTTANEASSLINTRLSNTFTGVKYETSTTEQGGTLTVDDREVTLGLYYDIA